MSMTINTGYIANNNQAIQNTDLNNGSRFRFAIWYLGT